MKKNTFTLSFILGFFIFAGIVTAATFSDITDHWAKDNLTWAINNGLLKGDEVTKGEDKTLRPDDAVTRAEMVTILKRYDELSESTKNNDNNNSFITTIGGITWIGRESEDGNYQAIKIDKLGNGTILYETTSSVFGGVTWDFSEKGKHVVMKGWKGGADGSLYTEIGFIDGEESIRSQYESWNGFDNELTFKLPDSPTTFNVILATSADSKACEGNIPNSQEGTVAIPQTTFIGVKISSGETSKLYEFAKPVTVDCAVVDGLILDHHPQNIMTDVYGISFNLPNGDRAWLSTSDGAEKMSINFR